MILETLVFVLAIIALAIIWVLAKQYAKPFLLVKDTPPSGFPYTGPLAANPDGSGWILNPASSFPIILRGINQQRGQELKHLFEEVFTTEPENLVERLAVRIIRYGIICDEMESYLEEHRAAYHEMVATIKESSQEWQQTGEKERPFVDRSIRKQAIASIDIRPYGNLEVLFSSQSDQIYHLTKLLDYISYENIILYLSHADKIGEIQIVPANAEDREHYEKMAKMGLAKTGNEIPLPDILRSFSTIELSTLVQKLSRLPQHDNDKVMKYLNKLPNNMTKIAQVIEYLISTPDTMSEVANYIPLQNMFLVKPLIPEVSELPPQEIRVIWEYVHEMARVLLLTYLRGGQMGQYLTWGRQQYSRMESWEVVTAQDVSCCPACHRYAAQHYPPDNPPSPPFHIGCRCQLHANLRPNLTPLNQETAVKP